MESSVCKVIPGESLTTQHRVLVMDGEKTNNSRQRKTQKDYKRGYKKESRN